MYQRELVGIPYIGNNYNIDLNNVKTIEQISLEDIVERFSTRQYIVVIDNNKKYYSYIRDICFDYVNSEVSIPYLTYDLIEMPNFKGKRDRHLLVSDNIVYIRHNYDIEKYIIYNKDIKRSIIVYDTKEKMCIKLVWDKLTYKTKFSAKDLYEKYINCIANIEDERQIKNIGGYNYITKEAEGFTNVENRIRKSKGINTFKYGKKQFKNKQFQMLNYRDVRNIKVYQLIELVKANNLRVVIQSKLNNNTNVDYIIHDNINYIDRLRSFELSLFYILEYRLKPIENKYSDIWDKLSKDYYSVYPIGDLEYKLLFKGYWINNNKPNNKLNTIYYRVSK